MKQLDLFLTSTQPSSSTTKAYAKQSHLESVCLFSSAGIGELGIKASGISIIAANEIVPYRVELYRENFKNCEMFAGDINEQSNSIVGASRKKLQEKDLFLLYATPPCQGMSSNGIGRLKWEAAQGRRSEEDERNRLIIPTMDVACALRPRWVLLENVPGMRHTEIRTENNEYENIISYVRRRLGEDYVGGCEVIACHDYGIPQRRKRLITIFTRDPKGRSYFENNGGSFFAKTMMEPSCTLRQAIGHLPELDAVKYKNSNIGFHSLHYVPIMNEIKYWWVKHTREGDTAFNNQCVNPSCGFSLTPGHKDVLVNGKWVASKEIPIDCLKCGEPLPRPTVIERDGSRRAMKGFHSAYRRMRWDEPSRTLTQNFIYEASDNKIHPTQNRVLSVYEATILQTIDRYPYEFSIAGTPIGTARIAEVIGESVPPYLIEKICKMMISVSSGGTNF